MSKLIRIGTSRGYRSTDYHFDRREPEALKRVPWESEGDRFPECVEWGLVGDVIVLMACFVGVVLILTGVIP